MSLTTQGINKMSLFAQQKNDVNKALLNEVRNLHRMFDHSLDKVANGLNVTRGLESATNLEQHGMNNGGI